MAVPQKKAAQTAAAQTAPAPAPVTVAPATPDTSNTSNTAPKAPSLTWGSLGGPNGVSARNKALIAALKTATSLSGVVEALKADPAFEGGDENGPYASRINAGNVGNHLRALRKVMTEAGMGHLVPTFGKGKRSVDTAALAKLFETA